MKHTLKRTHASIRLQPDVQAEMEGVIDRTGWSANKAINVLISAGLSQLNSSPDAKLDCQQIKNIRDLIRAATTTHAIEQTSAETLRRARGTVRQMERKVRSQKRS